MSDTGWALWLMAAIAIVGYVIDRLASSPLDDEKKDDETPTPP